MKIEQLHTHPQMEKELNISDEHCIVDRDVFEKIKIDTGKISDGYHTFDELYEHRITLFIALCKQIQAMDHEYGDYYEHERVWKSKLHSDGTMFDDWFVMGIGKEKGKQITYHLPISKWEEAEFFVILEKAPEWDGHTPEDVLKRIKNL